MNILLCSVGRRVKLVEYFKEELNKMSGQVIAVDCDPTAPALYYADIYEVVPRIDHPEYIQHIINLCHKFKVNGVLSLIDPELSLLAHHKKEFENAGIRVIISDKEIVDLCYDKYKTSKFLEEHNLPYIPTYMDTDKLLEDIKNGIVNFPFIVKPKKGSASMGIFKVNRIKELLVLTDQCQEYVIQPFMNGEEFGVDVYRDLITKETTHIFMKRKIRMRAGETDKSIAIIDPALKQVVETLMSVLQFIGPIDIDCFKTEKGYVISEINPRFGGGYLHAHEMGQNFVRNIINNMMGEPNVVNRIDYKEGTTLIKYDHYIVI
jgi:carbamoyl-phosphate synthase large subunit